MNEQPEWVVLFTDTFTQWFNQQPHEIKKNILQAVAYLEMSGPMLQRPYADTVYGSRFSNMKELRVQARGRAIRAFYAFDPERKAIVLCAGDKTGEKRFYVRMISLADRIFEEYLKERGKKP